DTQLYKAELALLSTVSEYPALPEALANVLAGFAPATETADTTRQRYVAAIMAALNAKARERNYDSIATAVTYLNDANATFAAEAKALFDWRSAVWTYATEELAKVEAGGTIPTLDAFIAAMPVFAWPQAATTTEGAAV
ncbi:hypothetical protein NAC44_10520, partial [Allorhizobium sp. BGMRC 0089]|uniref:hypothetical protein n=1 Tax=Allorhizobium sonneratiae TaxID=2934936 RepID=UPI0020338574